jgi:hypothetical protein
MNMFCYDLMIWTVHLSMFKPMFLVYLKVFMNFIIPYDRMTVNDEYERK